MTSQITRLNRRIEELEAAIRRTSVSNNEGPLGRRIAVNRAYAALTATIRHTDVDSDNEALRIVLNRAYAELARAWDAEFESLGMAR